MKIKKLSTVFRHKLFKVSAIILLCSILLIFAAVIIVVRISTTGMLGSQLREMNDEINYYSELVFKSPGNYIEYYRDDTVEEELNEDIKMFLATNWYYVNKTGTVEHTSDAAMKGKNVSSDPYLCRYTDIYSGKIKDFDTTQSISSEDFKSKSWCKVVIFPCNNGKFIVLKYMPDDYYHMINDIISDICNFETVGASGYNVVIQQDGLIVSPTEKFRENWNYTSDSIDVNALTELSGENKLFLITLNGMRYYAIYSQVDGFYAISLVPRDEVISSLNIIMMITAFLVLVLLGVIFLRVNSLTKRLIVKNINKVNTELSEITSGNLDVEINVRDNLEFNQLSDGINSTVNTLKGYIDRESKRFDRELELARAIQISALPNVFPPFPERNDIDIYAYMKPAKQVGGDFYDFFFTDDDHLVLLIADVSDKGIPAAMFMMKAKIIIKSLAQTNRNIESVIKTANDTLCEDNSADMFVTLWCGVLDTETGELLYVNAGHCRPLLRRAGGEFEYLSESPDFVIACEEDITYHSQKLILKKDDALFLYTDGVTEAVNTADELYGEEGLCKTLNSCSSEDAESICGYAVSDISGYSDGAAQTDDITMLAVVYHGSRIFEEMTINAVIDELESAYEFLDRQLRSCGFAPETVSYLNIAIDEICANIVKYAYPEGNGKLTVGFMFRPSTDEASITFTDTGIPFNPLNAPVPDLENVEDRKEGGMGIFLVRKFSDRVYYEYSENKNILTIVKKRKSDKT